LIADPAGRARRRQSSERKRTATARQRLAGGSRNLCKKGQIICSYPS
jgi:hypothetical protein